MDHIIPRAVLPEIGNVIANLKPMPQQLDESKNAKLGDRQRDMTRKFCQARLLCKKGLTAVLRASLKKSSRRREEADNHAIWARNPPPYVGGYGVPAIFKHAVRW